MHGNCHRTWQNILVLAGMSVNHNIRVTSAELFTGKQQLYSTPKACSALAEKKTYSNDHTRSGSKYSTCASSFKSQTDKFARLVKFCRCGKNDLLCVCDTCTQDTLCFLIIRKQWVGAHKSISRCILIATADKEEIQENNTNKQITTTCISGLLSVCDLILLTSRQPESQRKLLEEIRRTNQSGESKLLILC